MARWLYSINSKQNKMSAEFFFLIINIIASIGWIILIALSPFWKSTDDFLIGIIITLLAIVYSVLNFGHIGEVGGPTSFLTFDGVVRVFSNQYLIDAGWAHIIAFDIFVGIWIKNNAAKSGIKYGIVIPILLITIMLAPLGFLIYQVVRSIKTKNYFVGLC